MHCSNCGHKVSKTLSVRTHSCQKCGTVLDRDENAAINILNKALNEVGIILSACGGLGVSQPMFRFATCNAQRCASTRKKLLCLRSYRYNL
ncbi:transposase [Okeania sp. KiyG1]|uniref:transposase n=1 Tax=Okeania sp. KiyG1 TaxID=2720165 RepID=UPI001F373AC2|nr:transposase [Okeania sp. KiyG1]